LKIITHLAGGRLSILVVLLALFIVAVVVAPPSGRDFALLVLAMVALGVVLFIWSRLNGRIIGDAASSADPGSDPLPSRYPQTAAETLHALLLTFSNEIQAPCVGMLALEAETGELVSTTPVVIRNQGKPAAVNFSVRVSSSDAATLLQNTSPHKAESLARILLEPLKTETVWAMPAAWCSEPRGVLFVAGPLELSVSSQAAMERAAAMAAAIIAAESERASFLQELDRISGIVQACIRMGAQAALEEVKRAVVESAAADLGSDLVALYTIDPALGDVECETTQGVTPELRSAFQEAYPDVITDRDRREPLVWTGVCLPECSADASAAAFADAGIDTIIASPVRSEVGVSGALVVFYRNRVLVTEERRRGMRIRAELIAAALSHASAMEQSGSLLDDLVGANQELSLQATMDGLTGLANHRTLQQTLSDLCKARSSGRARRFCLIMTDADHFKMYNDTHGHRAGDAALREIAKVISSELRQGDLAARYGGEEFAIVLKGIGKDTALGIAERIRRRMADHQLSKGSLTISMGLAEFPADGAVPAEVIERADRALYHAKVTGRNRVVVWGSGGCSPTSGVSDDGKNPKRNVLLIASHEDPVTSVVTNTMESQSWSVCCCNSLDDASVAFRAQSFDLALVSVGVLPGADLQSLGQLASVHPDLPIVLLAPEPPVELTRAALRLGAADVLTTPFTPEELTLVVERSIERRRMERQRLTEKSTSIMLQAIEALVAAIDAKDHYTAGHSNRVTTLALAISNDLSLSNEERYALELAAKIHDIGKVALPDSALNKQSPLNEEEWRVMRDHPAIGCKIVGTIDELAYVSAIIRHHHERLDGTGYPDGLLGDAIPYLSRVIAVADAYEAMTSERAYRGRLAPTEAIAELRSRAGSHYAGEIVDILERKLLESGEIKPARKNKAA
jgi:putative two-component system response regulator